MCFCTARPAWVGPKPSVCGRAAVAAEVEAGAEPPAGAGEHHDAAGVVDGDGVEGGVEALDQPGRHRVQLLRAVHRDAGDAGVRGVEFDVGHRGILARTPGHPPTTFRSWPCWRVTVPARCGPGRLDLVATVGVHGDRPRRPHHHRHGHRGLAGGPHARRPGHAAPRPRRRRRRRAHLGPGRPPGCGQRVPALLGHHDRARRPRRRSTRSWPRPTAATRACASAAPTRCSAPSSPACWPSGSPAWRPAGPGSASAGPSAPRPPGPMRLAAAARSRPTSPPGPYWWYHRFGVDRRRAETIRRRRPPGRPPGGGRRSPRSPGPTSAWRAVPGRRPVDGGHRGRRRPGRPRRRRRRRLPPPAPGLVRAGRRAAGHRRADGRAARAVPRPAGPGRAPARPERPRPPRRVPRQRILPMASM